MARKNNKNKETNINEHLALTDAQRQGLGLEDLPDPEEKEFIITKASMNDLNLNYSFKVVLGLGCGDTHSVHGSGLMKDSLIHSFGRLRVHLAVIDDAFRNADIEMDDIDQHHTDEIIADYHIVGIEVKGAGEAEMVKIIGNKYSQSGGGRIETKTPWMPLDNVSSYQWYNELKAAVDTIRDEVSAYKNGNYDTVEAPDEKPNPLQLTIGAEIDANEFESAKANKPETNLADMDLTDFENAKV
jgi:hypothetical protein